MMIAFDEMGSRIFPATAARGRCPICGSTVRAKCGRIVVWHWAHEARDDCDTWAEPDTLWHHEWQEIAPRHRREVVIGEHRADIVTHDGRVIELQHSYLPPEQISAREQHYGHRMAWLFDARDAYADDRLLIRRRSTFDTFRWKHPRKSIGLCRRPVLLDLGDGRLFLIKKIHTAAPCGGWGHLRTYDQVTELINGPEVGAA